MPFQPNNETKPWDRGVPFARINSRTFSLKEAPANGRGYDCGCRNPNEDYVPTFIAAILVSGVFDALEGLVPDVPDELKDGAEKVLKEVGGADFEKFKEKFEKFKKDVSDFIGKHTEGLVFKNALRQIPAWVPVNRPKHDKNFKEVDKEVEGVLTRSFQSCTDLPLSPWNRFYNWNLHVILDDKSGFESVVGRGNRLNASEEEKLVVTTGTGEFEPAFHMFPGRSPIENAFECVWDVGAFSSTPGNTKGRVQSPGAMFHEKWPFWPMKNDRVWTQGRWVYDCTHVREVQFEKTKEETDLMWTQIHPCRAMACYRYEGFKFDENLKRVPASRFLFFACRKGGYKDFEPFNQLDPTDDPVFIVDLPQPPVTEELVWPIGHTVHFDLNTVVLRPRLLIKVQFLKEFGIPGTVLAEDVHFGNEVNPKIEPMRSNPEIRSPDQVKVTIPLSQLPEKAPAFGVVISMGWADPSNEQAARVKKVTITFDDLRHLTKSGELRFKFCANGHWSFKSFHGINSKTASLGVTLPPLFLPDDATLSLSAHGMERHGFGEVMEENTDEQRRINFGGLFDFGSDEIEEALKKGTVLVTEIDGKTVKILPQVAKNLLEVAPGLFGKRKGAQWEEHIDQPDNSIASAIARELFFKPFPLHKKDVPLGMLDDGRRQSDFQTRREASDVNGQPILQSYMGDTMSDLLKGEKIPVQKQIELRLETPQCELVGNAHMVGFNHRTDGRDYTLHATVTIEEQD